MGFTKAIKTCWKKSFSIEGCASRSEYWWFIAFQYLVSITLMLIMIPLDDVDRNPEIVIIPIAIFILLTLPARFCAMIRRLHDQNLSGWWFLIGAVPYVGGIILLIFLIQGSDPNSRFRTKEEQEEMNMPKL